MIGEIIEFVIMAGVISLLFYPQFFKSKVIKPYLICLYEGIIVAVLILYGEEDLFIPLSIFLFFYLNDRVKEKASLKTEVTDNKNEKKEITLEPAGKKN
ncbi:hypothetical protein CN918_31850 [Priestia megaterium]|nr:hypothetical protein CN918_31850 [Priestia megaterium]